MKNNKLVAARKKKGYTQEELAKLLGVRKSTVSNWETGYSIPRLSDAYYLSKLLETNIGDIFFDQ